MRINWTEYHTWICKPHVKMDLNDWHSFPSHDSLAKNAGFLPIISTALEVLEGASTDTNELYR